MAEIRVERKTGLPWWGYLLGLLILLAVAGVAVRGCGTTRTVSGASGGSDDARVSAQALATANDLTR